MTTVALGSRHARSARLPLFALALLVIAASGCGGDSGKSDGDGPSKPATGDPGSDGNDQDPKKPPPSGTDPGDDTSKTPEHVDAAHWFAANTVAQRGTLPMASLGATLDAQQLALQLQGYDPGSLLRCSVADQPEYKAAIDALGGVTWGYQVVALEDQSKPRFQAGLPRPWLNAPTTGAANDAAGAAPVEIVKPDIVAVTDAAALFYSTAHGLMVVSLTSGEPKFQCATQLPGVVDQFFFKDGHLVVMAQQQQQRSGGSQSFLLHFKLDGDSLSFVESVKLGDVRILDSRRFNDKLVFYTDLRLQPAAAPVQSQNFPGGGAPIAAAPYYGGGGNHRSLRVFTLGDELTEELNDTLIDTTVSADQLINAGVSPDTAVGTVVNESRRYGTNMWASDHYFAVTEEINKTKFASWVTQYYNVCTQSHVVETPYTSCTTKYEERPNPDYVAPDNSSGDRACKGVTLADCLRNVARVSNKTIQVPVGQTCVEAKMQTWICDRSEQQMTEYPTFSYESVTQLYIYEYTPDGFVRLDTHVNEITNTGLNALALDEVVPKLTTSTETFDLTIPGSVQTLQFQDGYLYVISQGVLQVYTLSGGSMVRTATLQVVNDSLQSTLWSEDKLYLSDFGYHAGGMDESVLRVVNLSNPAFPTIDGATHTLPGGHSKIIAARDGILTIGAVQRFDGENINAIKLGLFSDPYAEEEAYLILATQFANTWLGGDDSSFFSGAEQRLLTPYWGQGQGGQDDQWSREYRVSVAKVVPDEIVSEGAVTVPEPVQRVRPIDAEQKNFLTFAEGSIEWLTPNGTEWQSQPVLEYFKPIALLRLNDSDDYAEVQRLGDRCKLFLSNAQSINQRDTGTTSDEFPCAADGSIRAYDHSLLFADSAVRFDDKAAIATLTEAERTDIEALIAKRQTCLLSTDYVDNPAMDYTKSYDQSQFTCVGPEELQMLVTKVSAPGAVPGAAP